MPFEVYFAMVVKDRRPTCSRRRTEVLRKLGDAPVRDSIQICQSVRINSSSA